MFITAICTQIIIIIGRGTSDYHCADQCSERYLVSRSNFIVLRSFDWQEFDIVTGGKLTFVIGNFRLRYLFFYFGKEEINIEDFVICKLV